MSKELIITVVAAVFIIVSLVLMYKYKKEYLKVIAYYAVLQAEELYTVGHGKEKLQIAIRGVKEKLPWYLAWLVSEKVITGVIESVLSNLQVQFKNAKNKQIESLDTIIKVGCSTANVSDVVKTAEDMKRGYIEGYAEGRTDFKGNSSGVVGVKAGLKI